MEIITYEKMCIITAHLVRHLKENPGILLSPGKIQNLLHLHQNHCKEIYTWVGAYKRKEIPARWLILSIVVAKYWHPNMLFENCKGDVASWLYINASNSKKASTINYDFFERVKNLDNFLIANGSIWI